MRIYIPHISWEGNFGRYFEEAFGSVGVEVCYSAQKEHSISLINKLHLNSFSYINRFERKRQIEDYNKRVIDECLSYKPDVFFVFNESRLTPHTIQTIRNGRKCLMVNFVGDDPWDSIRWVADYPHSLKYFDIIITGDPIWNNNIRKVSPSARIFWDFGGYDDSLFTPVAQSEFSAYDYDKFAGQLAFTGSSYGEKPEGAYRAEILNHLAEYDLRIWGRDRWDYRFRFDPALKGKFKGETLSYSDLRKLYSLTKIFINLPAPQVTFGFQPRVFEIGGCKGFQIADNRLLIRYMFDEDELVVFDSIGDLKDKINYYLDNEDLRHEIARRLYEKVRSRFSWSNWATRMIGIVDKGNGVPDLDILLNHQDASTVIAAINEYCGF